MAASHSHTQVLSASPPHSIRLEEGPTRSSVRLVGGIGWVMCSDAHALGANLVESLVDGRVQVVEHALHLVLGGDWVNELH